MDDVGVRKLVELIFVKQVMNIAEITALNSSIPACLLTENFTRSMNVVLTTKQTVATCRWKKLLDTCYDKMFTSHEMYLRYIMAALQTEHRRHKNVFESFISVCAVLINLSAETLLKTEMNFCDLNQDIFMVFYESAMKKRFRKDGGFQQLVEHILGHKYVTWNPNQLPITSFDANITEKITGEIFNEGVTDLIVNSDETADDTTSSFLAQKVLSMTSVRFPTLLSKHELVPKLVAYRRNEIKQKAEVSKLFEANLKSKPIKKVSKWCSISNPNYKTSRAAVQKEDIKECEDINEAVIGCHLPRSSGEEKLNKCAAEKKEDIAEDEKIIEAVIRYNHSKSSGQEEANNPDLKTAYGILEHLEDNIKSLMEVLDEYDEE